MKKLLLGILPLLMISCAPRVTSVIMKSYPARNTNEKVVVYQKGDSVPSNAEALGKVAVSDAGMTTNCKYPVMIELAKAETRKMGGNGFVITEERLPSVWGSSCHQLAGTAILINKNTMNDSVKTSFKGDVRVDNESYNKAILPPSFEISANIGYGKLTSSSNNLSVQDMKMEKALNSGVSYDISLHSFFKNSTYGLGVMYSGYNSSYTGLTSLSPTSPLEYRAAISYFAPVFIQKIRFSRIWMFNYQVGIGYVGVKETISDGTVEDYVKGSTVGSHFGIGLECMVSKRVGIGTEFNYMGGVVSKLTDSQGNITNLPDNQKMGLNRLNFNIGLRLYLGK